MTSARTGMLPPNLARPWRTHPEEQIVALAQSGNRDAFAELILRYERYLKGLAYSFMRNPVIVDDIVADSVLQALTHLDGFVPRFKFSTWLGRIVVNQCLTLIRAERRRPWVSIDGCTLRFPATATTSADGNPEQQVAHRELMYLLSKEIERIPSELRAPLTLCLQQCSAHEIAEELGISVPAVKSRLHRARQRLKARFVSHLGPRHCSSEP